MEKGSILVYVHMPDVAILKEILAGAEEEGLRLTIQNSASDAVGLSQDAAQSGSFGVGIGIAGKAAAMSIRAGRRPIFELYDTDAAQYRLFGHNAGRYVKKEPFLL